MRWLFKTEPGDYSLGDLLRDKQTVWDGVKNALALIHLRKVRKGDEILLYHTGKEKAVVGIAKAISAARGDSVAIAPVRSLSRAVPLGEIKADPFFRDFALIRIPRLAVMPVPDSIWRAILDRCSRPL